MPASSDIGKVSSPPDPWALWLAWASPTLAGERAPWSGDVTQWIRAWGEAVGQVGLFNINYAGSSDPQAERRITGRYSYGRQLGRLMDVLVPYVQKHEADFRDGKDGQAVREFLAMAREIEAMKQTTVDDLLAHAKKWRKNPDFKAKLEALRRGLDEIEQSSG
ncbi:hypothetical protein FOB72_22475 [Cupriavidus pauculus]|jgi:hypothetical protein|uniref:Uncharacterized protein n=1 Tax=Cupriavidus pauculus TaxID=82633 RepID=A0A5P2HBT9_9BURK|nr:hypothetical protein [Cupriavidus pauculus]QET04845.1 hypothetical protein FOB72_22475 [Cupriavidus pauculus]